MSYLDHFMPTYALRQVDRVAVAAAPEKAWPVVRGIDFFQFGIARLLFGIRTLPMRLFGGAPAQKTARIDDITGDTGFLILGEEKGREVVVGSVGKFWQPRIEFAKFLPGELAGFDRPGYGKLAWSLRVDPREGGGAWITFDLRVAATDAATWRRFQLYWLLIGRFSHAMRAILLRHFVGELGPASDDDARPLPGDDIVAAPRLQKTHAVTIEAPPAALWPWLVQMGARRAGWYSIDRLDNGGTPSAERIVPELQHLAVGDILPALPSSRPGEGFAVLRLEPQKLLVLGDPALLPSGRRDGGPPWSTAWAFVLEPIGDDATHLVVRVRARYAPTTSMAVARPFIVAAHEIMERSQLRNLRQRAERLGANPAPARA
jgi:hypothetical protein